jgi:aryl-alcohol dehydrogenase-like predicted oxidoreductase
MLQNFIQHPDSHIDYVQDFYNIIEKKAESLIFPYLHETCEFMAYSPFYRGLLTSTWVKELLLRNEEAINRLIRHNDLPLLIKQKKLYEEIAKIKWVSIEQIAIDFLKSHKKVNHILFWTTNKEHLDTILNLIK